MSAHERPRGTRDFKADEMERRRWLERSFRDTFRLYGYREIQTPTFEHTALFEAKSGPNVVNEIYEFKDKGGRSLALRPELTAPVLRFYVNELSQEPKPLKLYYHGPCFRYEEPQEGRYREFWQFGLELIGPEGPAADAEVIAVAVDALRRAGLRKYTIHVGHIGVLRALVAALPLDDARRAETFRRIDKDDEKLGDFLDAHGVAPALRDGLVAVAQHAREMDLADATAREAYFAEARDAVAHALPAEALERARRDLDDLHGTLRLLAAQGVERAHVDLGVARGLDYYTGVVFEFHADVLGSQSQIGGGGAYALAELFGGERVGSCGFGLGFDRILIALERENALPALMPTAQAYVAILGAGARETGISLAQSLRRAGVATEADLMGRSLSKSLAHAAKVGARVVVIAGEKDLAEGRVTLRDMTTGGQEAVPLAEAAMRAAKMAGL